MTGGVNGKGWGFILGIPTIGGWGTGIGKGYTGGLLIGGWGKAILFLIKLTDEIIAP